MLIQAFACGEYVEIVTAPDGSGAYVEVIQATIAEGSTVEEVIESYGFETIGGWEEYEWFGETKRVVDLNLV